MHEKVLSIEEKAQNLNTLLQAQGITTNTWTGENGTKTILDLVTELESGESELTVNERGEVVRKVKVVAGVITYHDKKNQTTYLLREDRQESKIDGTVKRRPNLKGAVSEKMKAGEDPQEAVLRGIQEELVISGNFTIGTAKLIEDTRVTETYPGLKSVYSIYKISVEIDEKNFNPNGYTEEQPTKTTYFVWDIISSNTPSIPK